MQTTINYITLALVAVLLALVVYQQTLLADIQSTGDYSAGVVHRTVDEVIPFWCNEVLITELNHHRAALLNELNR